MLCGPWNYSALGNSSQTFATGTQLRLTQTTNAS